MSIQPTAVDVVEASAEAPLPSGRLLLRMPPNLHAELTQAAEREGSSLNGYITARLRESVGRTSDDAPEQEPSDPASTATLTRVLMLNAAAVSLAAVVAVAILFVAWLG